MPHSPNLVPQVGGERSKECARTREAMTELGLIICEERRLPTAVIVSPHSPFLPEASLFSRAITGTTSDISIMSVKIIAMDFLITGMLFIFFLLSWRGIFIESSLRYLFIVRIFFFSKRTTHSIPEP